MHETLSTVRRLAGAAVAAGLWATAGSAAAAPVLGSQLFWGGGDVTIEVQASTAGYTSELRLFNPDSSSSFIAYNAPNGNPAGTTVTLLGTSLDTLYNVGDELIFGIVIVYPTTTPPFGDTFKLGPGSRNADGLIHGAIDSTARAGWLRVGFEDIRGGGDLDYDDNVFDFQGSVTSNVPEPGALALVSLALVGAGLARRRRPA
jgi:hypothetical protein